MSSAVKPCVRVRSCGAVEHAARAAQAAATTTAARRSLIALFLLAHVLLAAVPLQLVLLDLLVEVRPHHLQPLRRALDVAVVLEELPLEELLLADVLELLERLAVGVR